MDNATQNDQNGQEFRQDKPQREEQFRQGVRLLHEGNVTQAVVLLEPLYKADPDNVELALNLGGAYVLQERYDDARELLDRAVEVAPGNANLWINLGAARLGGLDASSEAQQEAAIAAYEQALQADPAAPNVHYMLGLIHHARNNSLRATAHFTRALEQNPQDNDARRMLAAIAAERIDQADDE